jgi:hypothetical protein
MTNPKVRNAAVIQSMRMGTFGGFKVLGSQYRDEIGEHHWYVALLPSEKPSPTIHHILAGLIPEQLEQEERDAIIEALTLWEREPAARPN